MEQRTPKNFVDDMQAHGRDWIAIMAVASVIRDGRWKEEVKSILLSSGIMPRDEEVAKKQRIAAALKINVVEAPSRYVNHSKK